MGSKILRISMYVLGSVLLLLLVLVLLIVSPAGKRIVRHEALKFLRGKLKTEVQIGAVEYSLPKMVGLRAVLLRDEQGDTLLSAERLAVDIDLLDLLRSKVSVNDLQLEGLYAHVYRNKPDTSYNFSYIVAAFASKDTSTKVKDTNSAPFVFDVGKVSLKDIRLRFEDEMGGMKLAVDLQSLDIQMKELDPTNRVFKLKSLAVKGLKSSYAQDSSLLVSGDTSSAKPIRLAVDELDLQEVAFNFKSTTSATEFDLQMTQLRAHPKTIDLAKQLIVVKDFALVQTKGKLWIGKQATNAAAVYSTSNNNWTVRVDKIDLEQIGFVMDNENSLRIKKGIDYAHLGISALNLKADKIAYSKDNISGNIEQLSLKEQSGLDLQQLRTNFFYNDSAASLNNLYVQTAHSILQNNIEAKYPSIDTLSKHLALLQLKLNLQESVVAMEDVLLFAPQLAEQESMRPYTRESLKVDAAMEGYLDNLDIKNLRLAGLSNSLIDLKGKLKGLPDARKLAYELNINKLSSSRKDLSPLLPDSVQQNLRLPDAFTIVGTLSGTAKNYFPKLQINSTDGSASIAGVLKMAEGKGKEQYDLAITTKALNIGRIIRKDTLMGAITAQLKVKGNSFDMQQMSAAIQGSVQSAMLKGYAYKDISFDGNIEQKEGLFNLVSTDPNAQLSLKGTANFQKPYPSFLADLVMENVDLQALNLYEQEMRIHARVHADVLEASAEYPEGTLNIEGMKVAANGTLYRLDTAYVVSKPSADSGQNIHANLGFLQAAISGKIPLKDIPTAIKEHVNRHYKMDAPADSIGFARKAKASIKTNEPISPKGYNLKLDASIYKSPFLAALVPQMTSMDSIYISAAMDEKSLDLDARAPRIVYGAKDLKGFSLQLTERDSGMNYVAKLDAFSQGKIQLLNTQIDGAIDANLVSAHLKTEDIKGVQRFAMGATLQKEEGNQTLSLQRELMLDYNNWTVAQPNKIVFGKQGFYAENVKLSGNGASISVESESAKFNAPLVAHISNFSIADIMGIVSGDTLFADGILNGTAHLKQMSPSPVFDADFSIDNFAVQNDTLGNVALKAHNKDEHSINALVTIKGNSNDIELKGDYYTQLVAGNNFNFDLVVHALNVKSFEGLAQNQIRNSTGFVRGKVNIQGTTALPLLQGQLKTDNLQTTIAAVNAAFTMPSEQVVFNESGISFDNFKILDSAGNVARIDGDIGTKNLADMKLNLSVKAKEWQILSSTKSDNHLYYGRLKLSTRLDINGSIRKPNINGSLNILKGTNLSIVLPDRGLSMEDRDGIVVFVDKSDTTTFRAAPPKDTNLFAKVAPGSEINVNIITDPEAEFNVIIDQSTGDFLTVRGKVALNTAIDPGGSLSLNGIYELYSGVYQLNYNLIKRKFEIQKGSLITFAGDPLAAEMNVTAVYTTNVAPYTLVEKQVPDASQLVYYRQPLPFNVQLKMNGPLLLPNLTFDIVLPENNTYRISSEAVQLVQAKLSQLRVDTSELNKQVFALLILKRFITDDPFSSDAGNSASFTAKQSVSRFLGEQLNQFANQLVNGVDLSVDVASTEDYTTGERRERTDLNVAASKRLFNDRLKVTIGNNFELEGPQTQSTTTNSSYIPGNLSIDYSLSADNRYMIRAYRQSQDQGVIQGFVTETGVNFIVNYDYNRFRNLFVRKKVLEMRRKQRQEKNQENNTETD